MRPNKPMENLRSVLRMCEQMLSLANEGDAHRQDAGCGVVFGTLRDMAYKMRALAEKELGQHERSAKTATKRPCSGDARTQAGKR